MLQCALCEADAVASGLERDALFDQVKILSRLTDDVVDKMLRAHHVRPDGLGRVEKARILVGVPIDVVAPGRSSHGHSSPTSPNARSPNGSKVASPLLQAAAGGSSGSQAAFLPLRRLLLLLLLTLLLLLLLLLLSFVDVVVTLACRHAVGVAVCVCRYRR